MGANIVPTAQITNNYYNHYENKYKTNTNMALMTSSPTTNIGFRNPSKSFLHTTLQLNNNGSNPLSTLKNDTITNPPQTPNSNSNVHSCDTGSNNHKKRNFSILRDSTIRGFILGALKAHQGSS